LSLNWRHNESVRDDNASKRRSERMVIYRRCGTIRVCVEFHDDTQARGGSVSMLSTRHNTYAAEPILRLNNSESEKRGCTSLLHDRRCFTVESVQCGEVTLQLGLAVANSCVVRSGHSNVEETCIPKSRRQSTRHPNFLATKLTFCEWHS
jgi:hypothetical protein